jgi:flagellar biosynthesis/type III secretory pathway protein FliH
MYRVSEDAMDELWELANRLHHNAEESKEEYFRDDWRHGQAKGKEKAADELVALLEEFEASSSDAKRTVSGKWWR